MQTAEVLSKHFWPPNIYIVGAQCTGKTTLVEALQQHFDKPVNRTIYGINIPSPGIVREVARGVLKRDGFTANDITTSPIRALELQRRILEAQWSAESAQETWYVSDRSAIDPVTYATIYVGQNEAHELMSTWTWAELRARMKRSVVVVCRPGMKWLTDDGVRLLPRDPEEWDSVHLACCGLLLKAEVPFIIVPNDVLDLEKRLDLVLEAWKLACEKTADTEGAVPQHSSSMDENEVV